MSSSIRTLIFLSSSCFLSWVILASSNNLVQIFAIIVKGILFAGFFNALHFCSHGTL
jgi:fatty acid desaturase